MSTDEMMKIMDEIRENRKKFRVDHFDIVVSEYVSRYKERKIVLDPPYQRIFRWDIEKQSALIESILIGIPLPPIFAFSNDNYEWEIIDGVQRTTTLLHFLVPELFPEKFNVKNGKGPVIEGCTILKELNGKRIDDLPENAVNALKNARLRIELVEDNSDSYSQYLLFSRLNNNGEPLSAQELRNFLIYKLNNKFYDKLAQLRENLKFKEAFSLKKKRIDKQEDVEYILRFLLCRDIMFGDKKVKSSYSTIDELITKEIEKYLRKKNQMELEVEYEIFDETFDFIVQLLGTNAFRYFHPRTNSVINTSIIGSALSTNLSAFRNMDKQYLLSRIGEFFNSANYLKITSQSYSPTRRFFELSLYAKEYFDDIVSEAKK